MTPTTLTVGILAIAGALVLAYLYWDAARKRRPAENVPPGMRPGYSDEQLEKSQLERYMAWGVALTLFFAVFFPVYWIYETQRLADATEEQYVVSVQHGEELYQENCAECHGGDLGGGAASSPYEGDDPWPAPQLNNINARYEDNENITDIEQFVENTLYWGRPGSPMPAYGADAAGPFTDEEITNVVDYIFANQIDADDPEADPEAPEDAEDGEEADDAEDGGDAENGDAEDGDEAEDGEQGEDGEQAGDAQQVATTADASGEELYTDNCMRCHGPDLEGWDGEETRPGHPLIGTFERHNSAGLLGILRNGIRRPGSTPMPPWQNGYQHHPLEDEALVEIINYLRERQPADALPEGEEDELDLADIEALAEQVDDEDEDGEADGDAGGADDTDDEADA